MSDVWRRSFFTHCIAKYHSKVALKHACVNGVRQQSMNAWSCPCRSPAIFSIAAMEHIYICTIVAAASAMLVYTLSHFPPLSMLNNPLKTFCGIVFSRCIVKQQINTRYMRTCQRLEVTYTSFNRINIRI